MFNNLSKPAQLSQDFVDALPFVDARTLRKLPPQLRRQLNRQLNRMPDMSDIQSALPLQNKAVCRRNLGIALGALAVAAIVGAALYFFVFKEEEYDFDFELDL